MTNIKERVLQIAKYKGISYEVFSQKIGMTYSSFKGEAKKTPLNSDAIANILTIIPNISPEWLITGKGDMLRQDPTPSSNPSSDHNQLILYLKEAIIDKDKYIEELNREISRLQTLLDIEKYGKR